MNDDIAKSHLPHIRTRPLSNKPIPPQLDFHSLSALNTSPSHSTSTIHTPLNSNTSPGTIPPHSAVAETVSSAHSDRAPTPTTAGAEPSTPTAGNGTSGQSKEKRKRSRVTPDQLAQLERIFILDKSPTAQRRKEISDMLGMQERQTQIWFQNRRAKAKLQEVKRNSLSHLSDSNSPPRTPPDNGTYDAELQQLVHEDESIIVIPCTELSIGTWRRIATTPVSVVSFTPPKPSHDLVAYMSPSKRCLNWFIQSEGYGFKMEIPFDTVSSTELADATSAGGTQAMVTFNLARPPNFYLETMTSSPISAPRGRIAIGGAPPCSSKTWKRCADWTEGMQASSIFRHELIGNSSQIMHVVRMLRGEQHPHSTTGLQLLTPPYTASSDPHSSDLLRIPPAVPQLPLNIGSPSPTSPLSAGYYSDGSEFQHHRRGNYSPSFNDPFQGHHLHEHPYSPSAAFHSTGQHLPPPVHRLSYTSQEYGYTSSNSASNPGYISPVSQHIHDYPSIPISQAPRSSLSQVHPTSSSHSSTPDARYASNHTPLNTAVTPPLLTTPFVPNDGLMSGADSVSVHAEVYSDRLENSHSDAVGLGYPSDQA